MAQNKNHITPENITEWLASTGFLLPRNEVELARFDKLFAEDNLELTGKEIDPEKILRGELDIPIIKHLPVLKPEDLNEYKLVARNGKQLSKNILDKIKKNQNNSKRDDTSSEDESNK
jgi:hypothetical protein